MTDQPKRGGLRSPAGGRPKKTETEKKVKLSITISPMIHDWLKSKRTYPREPLSQVIERECIHQRNSEMLDTIFGRP